MVLDAKSQKNIQLMQEFLKDLFLVLLYIVFYYTLINNLPADVICNITVYADDTTLCSKCDQASNLWQELELVSEFESDIQDTVDLGKKWLVDFSAAKTELVF